MVSPAVQEQVPHPSIVPEFLRSTSCGMTSARGHGAIVYCLNSGSEDRQTGRHNGWKPYSFMDSYTRRYTVFYRMSLYNGTGLPHFAKLRVQATLKSNSLLTQDIMALINREVDIQRTCTLHWIPSRVDIFGNELADNLAKETWNSPQISNSLTLADAIDRHKLTSHPVKKRFIPELNCNRLDLQKKSLNDVRSQVKSAYQSNSAITDIDVTFDGTWLTRGHSSQIGVGCVIDLLTGFVMDFEIMSKRCIECEHAESGLGENSAEFHVCGFRYTTLLSDGDAKTYQYLNTTEVYGPEIKIKKECMNHVSKRLGTSLRKAVKEWQARGVSLGVKSRGSLKEDTIKKFSRYYQNAIRSNKGDVEAKKPAIYATLFHSMSTDQKPEHFKCPTGKDSWCFFQAALARGEVPGPHVKHVKTPLKGKLI
ncbi:uncharacterized protein TNCV_4836801 [Trichonephila clavipes]|nr:uncharacterized protein TNCV_4836801 [Trichonephila clavipes]